MPTTRSPRRIPLGCLILLPLALLAPARQSPAQPPSPPPSDPQPAPPPEAPPPEAPPAPPEPRLRLTPATDPIKPLALKDDAPVPAKGEWFELEPPESTEAELDELYEPHLGILQIPPLDAVGEFFRTGGERLAETTGLRLGFAYTMVFLQASGGPGNRSGASGDIDFLGDWTFIGRGTENSGRLVFSGEYRFRAGSQPASGVGPEIGVLSAPIGGFNDRGWAWRDLHYQQRLLDDHLRIVFGRADAAELVGAYRLQSINNSFMNRAFSGNSPIPFPGHGITAAVTARPSDDFYATAGAANGYGRATLITIDQLFEEWDLFYFAEAGYTPDINDTLSGRYAVTLWFMDSRPEFSLPSDRGISLIAEQDLSDWIYVFTRYSYADEALERIRNTVQVGAGLRGLLGSPDNLTGLAFGYTQPRSDDLRDEKVIELFHRFQLTRHSEFTLDGQFIIDPADAPGDDALFVFGVRYRLAF